MDIGNVIRTYRKQAGLTQEEMANRLGVTTPAVNKWENGNSKPDIELLAPIARLLHISPDTLLSFHENLTPSEIGEIIRQMDTMFETEEFDTVYECQTAHCGRCKLHFDFGKNTSPIVPYRYLPQALSGITADCRSLI